MKKLLLLILFILTKTTLSAQFFEGFENTTGPEPLPSSVWTLGSGNWAVFNNSVGFAERWQVNNLIVTPSLIFQGNNSAVIKNENIGIGNTGEDYLATPLVTIPSNGQLRFFNRTFTSGDQGTIYQIKIAPSTASQDDPNAYIPVQQFSETELNSTYFIFEEKTVDLSAFAGTSVYIAFVKIYTQPTANLGGDRWYIDNVSVVNNNCPAPVNLTAQLITNTSATLAWTESGSATSWEVMLLPAGSPAPTPITNGIFVQSNPFVFTGLNSYSCYEFYVRSVCSGGTFSTSSWSGPTAFCTYDCSNSGQCSQALSLIAFFDANNNGLMDTSETIYSNGNFEYEINNSGTTLYGYTTNSPFYIFDDNPTNTYNLSFTIDSNYTSYFSSPSNYTNITLPTGSGSNAYYFPITAIQPLNDVEVEIIPYGNPRPGFNYGNIVIYKNKGTQTVSSGTISFTKNPMISLESVSQTGTVTTASGFDYTFSNLAPNEQRYIHVTLQVPTIPTVNLGDIITNAVSIEPLIGDGFPLNNSASISQTIIGSYDPNDKSESHGGRIVFDNFTVNDYLYYTIQFENTGTASAEFIRVEDVLDADLDENTFEMLNASHTVNTRREGNQLTWHFYNIDLPPTVTSPNNSHGYVHFRVKLRAGYAIGDIIPNTASIFFDYNPAIVTNTFNTEFVQSLETSNFNSDYITLYPNPADEFITVTNTNDAQNITSISIYEVTGKKIYTSVGSFSNEIQLNISSFAKGLYLLDLTTSDNQKITKKLIIQ